MFTSKIDHFTDNDSDGKIMFEYIFINEPLAKKKQNNTSWNKRRPSLKDPFFLKLHPFVTFSLNE